MENCEISSVDNPNADGMRDHDETKCSQISSRNSVADDTKSRFAELRDQDEGKFLDEIDETNPLLGGLRSQDEGNCSVVDGIDDSKAGLRDQDEGNYSSEMREAEAEEELCPEFDSMFDFFLDKEIKVDSKGKCFKEGDSFIKDSQPHSPFLEILMPSHHWEDSSARESMKSNVDSNAHYTVWTSACCTLCHKKFYQSPTETETAASVCGNCKSKVEPCVCPLCGHRFYK